MSNKFRNEHSDELTDSLMMGLVTDDTDEEVHAPTCYNH